MDIIGDVARKVGRERRALPWTIHVAYFLFLSMVGTLCLWLSPKAHPLSFIDAVYNAVSAVTETGLGSVEIHRFSLADKIALLLLMLVGSPVFTSAIPLFLRHFYFSPKGPTNSLPSHDDDSKELIQSTPIDSIIKEGGFPDINDRSPIYKNPLHTPESVNKSGSSPSIMALLPSTHRETMSHPSLTRESNYMDGNALVVMSWVTTCYFIISILGGFLICQIYILCSPHARAVLEKSQVNSVFFSIFSVVSAFGNCGYILLDDNLVSLQRSFPLLLCLSGVMFLGNTLYAPTLRLVVYCLYKITKGRQKQVYGYILYGSERQCYTHLFPCKETTWLVRTVIAMTGLQMICILGLDWKSQALKRLGSGYKIVIALFQSVATRTGGMNAVNLSGFSTFTLLVFLVAMYIAPYPIHLNKNQGSQRCNGISTVLRESVFALQMVKFRKQDFFLILATLLICIYERDSIKIDPLNFSFFNIIFEVISCYGNVGLTIGYDCALKTVIAPTSMCKNNSSSFSGRWNVGGKMVLIVVMMLGRHKGLSQDLDWNTCTPLS